MNATGTELLLDPDDMESHFNCGQAFVGLQQYEKALVHLDAILELERGADQAYMGRVLTDLGDTRRHLQIKTLL